MSNSEIYRGKRIDNGEWAYGYHFCFDGKIHFIMTGKFDLSKTPPEFESYGVIPESVGRIIELTDERKKTHPKRFFTGDIMRYIYNGKAYIGTVKIINGNACIVSKNASTFLDDAVFKHGALLIGNIIDNPELLEEGEVK